MGSVYDLFSTRTSLCLSGPENQNEDPHETCHASTFPQIGSPMMASDWSIQGHRVDAHTFQKTHLIFISKILT